MFSEAVDLVVDRAGRRDLLLDIISLTNATIRELHSSHDFWMDMREDVITPASMDTVMWPRPCHFKKLRTAKYGSNCWPDLIMPGARMKDRTEYYYGTGDCFAFIGHKGTEIKLAYYVWSPHLKYYKQGDRPAVYDRELCTWKYLTPPVDVDAEEAAQARVSTWMLENWHEVIVQGTLSKLFTDMDDQRAPRVYALFEDMRKDIIRTHGDEGMLA